MSCCCCRAGFVGVGLNSRKILFVAGGAGPPAAGSDDDAVWSLILAQGWEPEFKNDAAAVAGDATGKDAVYCSESCAAANVIGKFTNITVPLVLGEVGAAPSHNLCTGTLATAAQTQVGLLNTPQSATNNEVGNVTVTPAPQTLGSAIGANGATVFPFASVVGTPAALVYYGYKKGDVMAAAFVAPESRVAIGIRESSVIAIQLGNARTHSYIVQALRWAMRI